MSLTTDPNHPDLTRYTGPEEPGPQAKVYLVLSEEERAKGFIRPLRRSYTHVGKPKPKYPLTDLSAEDIKRFEKYGWVKYEKFPESEDPAVGQYWSQKDLDDKGCGISTKMGLALCETYARDPHFYGATYCVGCSKHLPVEEFVWDEDGERVGS
jgi:hypothetical protein